MPVESCPPCINKLHKSCINPALCSCHVCRRLIWEDPPLRTKRSAWMPSQELIEELKRNQGKWARIYEFPRLRGAEKPAMRINTGNIKQLQGRWEAKEIRQTDRSALYLRYVGE